LLGEGDDLRELITVWLQPTTGAVDSSSDR
jgi:hypothetical protein